MPRIVLSGGGTGGHITPILNCAQVLDKTHPDLEIHIISERGSGFKDLLASGGWPLHYIWAGKFRRYRGQHWYEWLFDFKTWWLNIRDILKLSAGFFQAGWLLFKLKPAAVFVKGGFVGLPVGVASWLLGIPLIIHESDVKAGLSNRILANFARTIAVGWPSHYYPRWQHKNLVFTGNVVGRQGRPLNQAQARRKFNLSPKLPTLLVMGGSSGATVINEAVLEHLQELLADYQLIHITGQRQYQQVSQRARQLIPAAQRPRYRPYGFLTTELGAAYQAADVVVSRAGANTIAELAAYKKPAIVVPHRYSPGNHQGLNAQVLADYEAAVVLDEEDLNKRLMQSLAEIQANPAKVKLMLKHLAQVEQPRTTERLAKEIIKLL